MNEYQDRRRRKQEHLLTAPYAQVKILDPVPGMDKGHHAAVQFKISPFARKVGDEVAALFGLSLSQYAKAVLYLNLGLVTESIDRRRKPRTS